jgi:hypothetical protein
VTPSSSKVMLTVFWDHKGILLTAFQTQMPTPTVTSSGNFVRPFNGSDQDSSPKACCRQWSCRKESHRLVPSADQRILCCWFSEACETMGQVPRCIGRLCWEIKAFFKSVLLFV